MTSKRRTARRLVFIGSSALVLAAVVLFAIHWIDLPPSLGGSDEPPSNRLPGAPPPPPAPVGTAPQSPFTPDEQAILRYLYRGGGDGPSRSGEWAQLVQEFEKAGGQTPRSLPFYLRLLNWKPRLHWSSEESVLKIVAKISGDRSAFRKPALERLGAYSSPLAQAAMELLAQIAEPEDAPAVAAQFKYVEFDDTTEYRGPEYFRPALVILAEYGTESEIAKIDKAKEEHLLWSDRRFWAKAEACKKAIRERLAKEKEKDDKK
jgi:hypothetical protein